MVTVCAVVVMIAMIDNGDNILAAGAIAGVIGTVVMMTLQIVLYNVIVCLRR